MRLSVSATSAVSAVLCLLCAWGCRQKMADQPRYDPLESSRFFTDGQSARPLVSGVVARGALEDDPHFFTGFKDVGEPAGADRPGPSLARADRYADTFPVPITPEFVGEGKKRFTIHCVPCHGRQGNGAGPVVEHGYPEAASFHTDRLRRAPAGYLFDVVTRGYERMPSYAGQVRPEERWAILAYIRALQLSRHAELDRLPPDVRERFESRE